MLRLSLQLGLLAVAIPGGRSDGLRPNLLFLASDGALAVDRGGA